MAGAWLTSHIWEHYSFTRDKNTLKANYPMLRDAAEFCLNWMIEHDGKLITSPSTSPENRFLDNNGNAAATHYGGTSDLAMIRECLIDARKAAKVLVEDEDMVKRIDSALKKMQPYQVNSNGTLREWYHEFRDEDTTPSPVASIRTLPRTSHFSGCNPGSCQSRR